MKSRFSFLNPNDVLEKVPFAFLLILSVAYSLKIALLSYPLVINKYPYISPDGFDWILEGFWLSRAVQGARVFDLVLPIARHPIFVFITFVDALLGQNGYGIAFVLGLSLFGTGYLAMKAMERSLSPLLSVLLLIALLLTPVNFVRKWVLSDSVCVFLSFATTYLLFLFYKQSFQSSLHVPILSLGIAVSGATQTYGLISPLVGLGVLFLFASKDRNSFVIRRLIYMVFLSVMLLFLFLFLWYRFIPHGSTPKTFELLDFSSFAMADFYFNVWIYYYAPFLPLLPLILVVNRKNVIQDPFLLSLWLTIIVFLVLTFFYQWKESRFTFIYWPFFVVAVFKMYIYVDKRRHQRLKTFLLGFSCALIVFQSFFLSVNEWQPNVNEIMVKTKGSWLTEFLYSSPVDRFQLESHCGAEYTVCKNMVVDENFDDYTRNTMRIYLDITVRGYP